MGKALFVDYYLDYWKAFARLCSLRAGYGVSVAISKRAETVSDIPLDIIIPVIDKDSDTLPFVIDSAREFLRHPITNIYLVCPRNSERIRAIAEDKGCVIVDEADILEIGKKDIDYRVGGVDRSGWLYQQFLKWCGDKFTTEGHYLILDSDTVLIAPHVFLDGGRQVFDYCDTVHGPYFEAYERLMGHPPRLPVSFTSHHTLVDKEAMAALKACLEARHGMIWYKAIIAAVDPTEMSSHSDYDTYGHFFYDTRKEDMQVRYWFNKSLPRKRIEELSACRARYQGKYRTLSFHEYRKE
jgi:hypothetical protein